MAAINEAGVVHVLEKGIHGAIALFIECERFTRPIARGAHHADLFLNGYTTFGDELVNAAQKLLAPQVMTMFFLLLADLFFDF